jgi:PBSX family phage terminase large subunit
MKILLKAPTLQQQRFINACEREQLYGGAKRGGKTVAGALKAVLLSVMFPGNRGLIARRDKTDLKDTSLNTFFEVCPPELILDHNKNDRLILVRTTEKPSTILYRGLGDSSDVEKSKGLDLGWFWVDEPSEIEEDSYLMLRSQLNWVLPGGNRPPYMALLTSNPEPGWVKRRFIDNMIDGGMFVPALPRDNPHLPPGWEDELRATYDSEWIEKYLNGSWSVAEGSVFPELNPTVHAIDSVDFRYMKFISGLDHATTGVTACLEVALDADENVFCLEEYYQRNRLISQHAQQIQLLLDSYGEQQCTWIDPSTQANTLQNKYEMFSVLEEYRRNGLIARPARRTSIDVGINLVKEYLHVNPRHRSPFTQECGSPRLFIVRKKCPNLWREMSELRRQVTESGRPEFIGDDHALDCLRYILMSRPAAPQFAEVDRRYQTPQDQFASRVHARWATKFDKTVPKDSGGSYW